MSEPVSTFVTAPPDAPAAPYPTRFSWPMRLFLSVLVFDLVFRSFSILIDRNGKWPGELAMRTAPVRFDTRAEREGKLLRRTPGQPHPVVEDVMASFDSVWEFLKPWPGADTRARLYSWREGGKFVFCWLNTRLSFFENLVGINEEWPMFSPYVADEKECTRARLTFADGSTQIVRQRRDPEDPCHYSHWFEEKVLNYERLVSNEKGHMAYNQGYCNLLAHRYHNNAAGSPLVSIRLYTVTYKFPSPGEDAAAVLRAQRDMPADQVSPDYYHYDVARRDGKKLDP